MKDDINLVIVPQNQRLNLLYQERIIEDIFVVFYTDLYHGNTTSKNCNHEMINTRCISTNSFLFAVNFVIFLELKIKKNTT